MKKRDLIEAARRYYNDEDTYNDLWKAVSTLVNLGLLDNSFKDALVKADNELFTGQGK